MKNLQGRREQITSRVGKGKEVSSDGRTVWVNINGQCVARFCPVSGEFAPINDPSGMVLNPHDWKDFPERIPFDWKSFVEGVLSRFGIEIGPEHRPLYVDGP